MVAASIQKMQVGTVVVGKPIPFDVYDAEGRLLLNRGYVISTQDQLDRLYERGLFVSQNDVVAPVEVAGRKTAVFAEVPSLIEDIETTVNRVLSGESDSHRRLMGVGRRIIQLSQDDPDACLALAHSHTPQKNICRQPLIHSLFVAMVGQQLQLKKHKTDSGHIQTIHGSSCQRLANFLIHPPRRKVLSVRFQHFHGSAYSIRFRLMQNAEQMLTVMLQLGQFCGRQQSGIQC